MRHGRRSDSGETLIEILMTVVILGTTVLAILAALLTAISSSEYHRKQANADIAAKAYAEALRLTVGQLYQDNWCTSHAAGYTLTVAPTYPTDWSGTVSVTALGGCPSGGPISTNVNSPQYRTATVTATATGGVTAVQNIVLIPSWCYNSSASTC